MPKIDIPGSTPFHECVTYQISPTRRDARVHISAEAKTNLPWNSVISTHPIPDWKAFYTLPNGSTHEVGLHLQMLAWDLPAVVLRSTHTNEPFYYHRALHGGDGKIQPYVPFQFPERQPLPFAGKDTVLLGIDVYPPGHSGLLPWMRSTIFRDRKTAKTRQSALLLVDPVGQRSLQLRTVHHNTETGQTVQVVISGSQSDTSPDNLDFQTRIRMKDEGRLVEYVFAKDGQLTSVQNAERKTIPVGDPDKFAQHTLGLKGNLLHHAQTLRSLWMNAGRLTPYNPLYKLITLQKKTEAVKVI